jgi:aryl-alcohol dehydrogenase-like predicted oxidoreductase
MIALGASGPEVSEFCLGGNVFGWTADEGESLKLLDAYVDGGGNFIDTADSYSQWADGHVGGESEPIIGRWLARRGRRDDVVLATKVGKLASAPGLGAARIAAGVEASLKRRGTDYIDLYYAHADERFRLRRRWVRTMPSSTPGRSASSPPTTTRHGSSRL